jgi:hypothetical protein
VFRSSQTHGEHLPRYIISTIDSIASPKEEMSDPFLGDDTTIKLSQGSQTQIHRILKMGAATGLFRD